MPPTPRPALLSRALLLAGLSAVAAAPALSIAPRGTWVSLRVAVTYP